MTEKHEAPTTTADERSTHIAAIRISDITLPEGATPILDRAMRVRRMDVFPGGVIGLHDHSDRPAILYVLHGSMTVHDETHEVEAVVEQGHAVAEFGNLQHWAKNNSDIEPLAILTFDLLDAPVETTLPPGH